MPFDCHQFAQRVASWLFETGPEADTVVSCRVRLARNLAAYPFVPRLDAARAVDLCRELEASLTDLALDGETRWVPMAEASPVLRLLLRERHLISRDLAPVEGPRPTLPGRAVAFGPRETVAVMVNEEDHVRLQAISPGFDLPLAWSRAEELDRALEARVRYATHEKLGYLTACPTNVGTGLRASVMLHLPALSMVRSELEKVFTAAQRTGLAVRGLYGEGSRAAGDFYQVSNQITLGRSEGQLVQDLRELVPQIVAFERQVRDVLMEEQRSVLQDRVHRSYGVLRTARSLQTESALQHLSNVRLGHHLGVLPGVALPTLNQLGVQVQRGHIQALLGTQPPDRLLEASERDRLRAVLLRNRLGESAN